MEFVLELLFDIIVEGSIELGSEKKVPMPLRILALFIVWTVFFGMGGIFIYMGYDEATRVNDTVSAVALIAVGGCMIIGGLFIAYKMFKKKREHEEELW